MEDISKETETSRVYIINKNTICFRIKLETEISFFYYYLLLDGFEYVYLKFDPVFQLLQARF